jgi:hypothetical protein
VPTVAATASVQPFHRKSRLPIVVRFGIQILTGASVFALVAGVAVVLNYGIKRLEAADFVSSLVLAGLRFVELVLFAADIICMVIFVGVESWTLIRAMFAKLKEEEG